MTVHISKLRRGLAVVAAVVAVAAAAPAQFFNVGPNTHIVTGSVYDGSGGPFLAGHIYLVNGSGLAVPAGQTLTVGSGVIVKLSGILAVSVAGTLNVNASSAQPAVITTLADDIGGDHNGDGNASGPVAGSWSQLSFGAGSSASHVTGLSVRYAGWNGNAAILCSSAEPTLAQCSTVASGGPCIDLSNNCAPTVTNCAFSGGTKVAIHVPMPSLSGFTGCTATGQTVYDAPEVQPTVAAGTATIGLANTFNQNGAVVLPTTLTVSAGATLSLGAGVVLKFTAVYSANIAGTLITNGTLAQPVVVTSIDDDSAGGDTNRNSNGSAPAPGQWSQLVFGSGSSASHVAGLSVRYAGWNGNAAILCSSANPTFTQCSTLAPGGPCLDLENDSGPLVTNCAFNGGTKVAIRVPMASLARFTGCTALGQTVYDAPEVQPVVATGVVTINKVNTFNLSGAVVIPTTLSVSAGARLNLGAGVVLKVTSVYSMNVSGTLVVTGTPASPVVLTSIHDDAYGGDTNRNGPATAPVAGQWVGLSMDSTASASQIHSLVVRYAGWNGNASVLLNQCNAVAVQLHTQFASGPGVNLSNNSYPTLTQCAFDTGNFAAVNVRLLALRGLINCTASGNSIWDAPAVSAPTVLAGEQATIAALNSFNGDGVVVLQAQATVDAGGALIVEAGVIFKFTGVAPFVVNGRLTTHGSTGSPVVLTSIHDDAYGGDTNKNGGASVATAGQWLQLSLGATANASTLQSVLVRCAGWNGNPAVLFDQSTASASGLRTQLCGGPCLSLNNTAHPTLTGCAFDGGSVAATNVLFGALAGFTNCTATGNAQFDAPVVTAPTVGSGETAVVTAANSFNHTGVIVCSSGPTVAGGGTLVLGSGTILKMTYIFLFNVSGTLIARGTDSFPVVVTSIYDDAAGGDTNKDGTGSAAAAGQWIQMLFGPGSDASVISNMIVRCSGWNGNATVKCQTSAPAFEALSTALCGGPCLDLNNDSFPTALRCHFDGGSYAATNVKLTALAGFRQCTATGNAVANAPRITSPTVSPAEAAVVKAINTFNGSGALHLAIGLTVSAGGSLDLGPGVVVKFEAILAAVVYGAVNWHGSGYEPVVLTSVNDDVFGGDSNVNGAASAVAPGQWSTLAIDATATGSLSHVRVRGAGWNANPSVACNSSQVALNAVRVDSAGGPGFVIAASAGPTLDSLVAWNCVGTGIRFDGPQLLRQATVANCGGVGIRSGPAGVGIGIGAVINSISWANGGGAFAGFGPGAATHCDGLATGTGVGNFIGDPQFVSAATGELTLQDASPCIDVAEPFTAFGMVFDHDEGSRISDGRLNGTVLPDLGAYERCAFHLRVTGHPWSLSTMTGIVEGPPATVVLALGPLGPAVPDFTYGFLLLGDMSSLNILGVFPTGSVVTYNIGDVSGNAGIIFGVQALAVPYNNPNVGAYTNLYRGVIDG